MYIGLVCLKCRKKLGYMNINQDVEPDQCLTRSGIEGKEYPIYCPDCYTKYEGEQRQ